MTTNRARSSTKRSLTVTEAKAKVVSAIRDGVSVKDAMALVERAPLTYEDWRRNDAQFREQIDSVREIARAARSRGGDARPEVPDFPQFCAEYLDLPLPEHHLRVWDVLQGREPRNMHPAIRFQKGRDNRVLLNFPPFHAKTQVWSTQYALWRMIKDPNVRVAIVSKTQELSKKIMYQIVQYLSLPKYAKMQAAFMPEGGWKGDSWTKTAIYLAGVDSGHKDPTLQALGLGGQIYGSRLDVVILDDLIDLKNAHDYKNIADYVGTEVDSRVDDDGVLHVLGTRMGSPDLYSELRDLNDWDDETPVWTWFAQPAVLERPSTDPNTWVTLWPTQHDGRPMWDGMALAKKKAVLPSEARWQLTYQQADAALDQVFPSGAVKASINGARAAGPLTGANLYTVLGVDPAADGKTAMIVMGLDRATGHRYVLDGFNMGKCPPDLLVSKIKEFVEKYHCREAVIERNAFQGFLVRLTSLREFMFAHGCLLTEHWTAGQTNGKTPGKWDEDLGVQSLAPLFLSCATHDVEADVWVPTPREKHLISLPNPKFSVFVDELVTQLVTWEAKTAKRGQLTDLVMALWFASIGIQKCLDLAKSAPRHMANPFLPRGDQRSRGVVNLAQLAEAQLNRTGEGIILSGSVA